MFTLPIADYSFEKVTDITPEFLQSRGISQLFLDLDNTIAPYGAKEPTGEVKNWAADMKNANIKLFIISNNRSQRPQKFARILDISFINRAKKPSLKGIDCALHYSGYEKSETALAGDQIYTDILAANRADILSILVKPIKFSNFLLAVRYGLEFPFRLFTTNKTERKN